MNFKQLHPYIVKKFFHYFQIIDYNYLLPATTYLPVSIGVFLTQIRGVCNAAFDLDWRSLSTGVRFVRKGTWNVIGYLRPESNIFIRIYKTIARFVVMSREEWEACFFSRHSMQKIVRNSTIKGLEPVLEAQKKGRGIILLTPHFDSYCTGMVLMGLNGLKLNVMTTNVIRHPMVNPAVQNYFKNKLDSMERFFNGGKIIAKEDNKRFFYRVLRNGESLVIAADLPATGKTSSKVQFLGEEREMEPGPLRLAQQTNSLITGFICLYQSPGKYHLEFTPLYEASDESLGEMYQFIEFNIRKFPHRWWASDVFSQYVSQ